MTIAALIGKLLGTVLAYIIGFWLIKKDDERFEKKEKEISNLKIQGRYKEAFDLEDKLYKR